MKDSRRILTKEDLLSIPIDHLPLIGLTHNMRSFVAARINAIMGGNYNHYLWYARPALFASQDVTFKLVSVSKYLVEHRIKLWWNPNWTNHERKVLLDSIKRGLKEPWYNRVYDPLQILGIRIQALTHIPFRWLQIPGSSRICSDHADYLRLVDERYTLKHPAPNEINKWCNETDGYEVYGRYFPD